MAWLTQKQRLFFTSTFHLLVAIVLAATIWFVSVSNSRFEADVEFDLEIRNIREGKALSEEAPRTAVLRFQGTGRTLAKLFFLKPFTNSRVVLDLERVQKRHVFDLEDYLRKNPQRVDIPILGMRDRLTFLEVVAPDSVVIVLDDYEEKLVPITADISLDVAPGYTQVGGLIIIPNRTMLKGAVRAVHRVTSVHTMRRTYEQVSAPLEFTVGLLHPDPGQVLTVQPPVVTIRVDVQMIGERRIDGVPVEILNPPPDTDLYVSPSTISLTVVGGVNFLAESSVEALTVFVDYTTQWSPEEAFVVPQIVTDERILEYRDLTPNRLEFVAKRPGL